VNTVPRRCGIEAVVEGENRHYAQGRNRNIRNAATLSAVAARSQAGVAKVVSRAPHHVAECAGPLTFRPSHTIAVDSGEHRKPKGGTLFQLSGK